MTGRVGDKVFIQVEPDERCAVCSKMAELRPAGPDGERVCFDCANKNPEALKAYAKRLMGGASVAYLVDDDRKPN